MGCFSKPTTTTQQLPTFTPSQMGLLDQIAGLLKPQLGQPYEGFPGQRVAPTSALTQQGMDVLGQTPQFAGGLASQGAGEIGQLLGGQSLDPIFQRGQTMFGREAEQIANKYGALDATSSSSARDAMSRALEQFTLASQAQAIPAQLQASQLGLGAIPSVSQIPQQTAQGLMAGGQVQQGQQQAIINDAMQRYMQQNTPMYSPYYSAAMNVLGLNPMENLALGQGAGLGYAGTAGILGGVGQGIGNWLGK